MKTSFSAKKAAPAPVKAATPAEKNKVLNAAPVKSGLGRRTTTPSEVASPVRTSVRPTPAAKPVKAVNPAPPPPEEVFNEPATAATQQVETTTAVEVVENVSTELAPPQISTALALPTGEMEGEISSTDLSIPHLQIVQAVGPLSEHYVPGELILAKEVVIAEPAGAPVIITVARIKKQYIENLPYSEATIGMAKVFDRLEDVRAAGGGIEWGANGERPSYVPIARAIVIIEAPQEIQEEPIFCYEFGGKRYAMALWTLRNTSYTRAAKAIYTAANFALRNGLATGCWELTTRREKAGDNFVHVPVLRQNAKNSPELVEFIHSITNPQR